MRWRAGRYGYPRPGIWSLLLCSCVPRDQPAADRARAQRCDRCGVTVSVNSTYGGRMTTATQLADEALNAFLDADPVASTLLGLRDRDDRLTDYTEAGDAATRARISDIAARARALGPADMPQAPGPPVGAESRPAGSGHDSWVTQAVVLQQAE